ncbi:MAG: PGF-CTERM sorting domain-containing protein [Euryarchaeota archaeon]|nr:PGF-CTERM sorting domain-containing protein [Euryarchaeota archaeon]
MKGLGAEVVGGGIYPSEGVPMIISESISKTPIDTGTTKSSDSTSLPKTPALGAMFAITGLLVATYLLRRG